MRLETLNKIISPLKRRVMLMVGRAVLCAVNDSSKIQLTQVSLLEGELRDQLERFQQYGFTSHPHIGAECAVVFLGGNRDHGIVIAVDDKRYRLKSLERGEVALYTDEGDKIHLKRNRTVEIETKNMVIKATEKIRFETPIVEVTGDINSNLDENSLSMKNLRERYNQHTHICPGGVSSTTQQNI